MLFRQLFDLASSTFTYLLADENTREAVLIDPVFEQHARDAALIRELDLRLLCTLDTHCHADHVTGAWLMHRAFGSKIGLSPVCQARNASLDLIHGAWVRFGSEALEVRGTPGHTDSCVSFVSANRDMIFTGDALLVRAAGRTDFQQGSPEKLYESIQKQIFSLPDACMLYPGHDYQGRTSSSVGEERRHNPRVGGGARQEDFVGYMNNLALPHPKQMEIAAPANMRCGEPEGGEMPDAPSWAPVVRTYAGVLEISPEWVAEHRDQVQIIDVRGKAELEGDLGRLKDTQWIPLDEIRGRAASLSNEKPLVVICQTGRRSALAATLIEKAGHARVANVAGGMALWRTLGLPS